MLILSYFTTQLENLALHEKGIQKAFLDFGLNGLIGSAIKGTGLGLLIFREFNLLCSYHLQAPGHQPEMSMLGHFRKICELLN